MDEVEVDHLLAQPSIEPRIGAFATAAAVPLNRPMTSSDWSAENLGARTALVPKETDLALRSEKVPASRCPAVAPLRQSGPPNASFFERSALDLTSICLSELLGWLCCSGLAVFEMAYSVPRGIFTFLLGFFPSSQVSTELA